jgi:hypothetical protein
MSRQPTVEQNMPPAAGDPYWQMLADAKASHDLMVALLGLADAAPRSPVKRTAAEKSSPARADEESPPAPAAEQ